jgi:hypothetical protein
VFTTPLSLSLWKSQMASPEDDLIDWDQVAECSVEVIGTCGWGTF